MYASIRRYQIISGEKEKVNRLVKNEFIPLIRGLPGFIDYYGIDAGNTWTSLSIFDTKAAAEESNKMAADWVRKNFSQDMIVGTVDITAGEVIVHETGATKTRAA